MKNGLLHSLLRIIITTKSSYIRYYSINIFVFIFALLFPLLSFGEIITKISNNTNRYIALTFDACETKTPSFFDKKIVDYMVKNSLPFTIFVNGKFAIRNSNELKTISKYDFVEIENHSFEHLMPMTKLSDEEFTNDILKAQHTIYSITGKMTKFFRFPGGFNDNRTVALSEKLGHKVVHWNIVSGDPDKKMTAQKIFKEITKNDLNGAIIIFHINGRGWHTHEALPQLVDFIKQNNFKIVKLEEVIQ